MSFQDKFVYSIFSAKAQHHKFHMVTPSPWPLMASLGALMLTAGSVMFFHSFEAGPSLMYMGLSVMLLMMFVWWSDVISESTHLGYHTRPVLRGLSMGVMLFMVSEIMFFFAFFWAFFHASMAPGVDLGGVWPPVGINILNPLHMPLLNTFILLMSGVFVTLSHHSLCVPTSDKSDSTSVNTYEISVFSLISTLILAMEFTLWQLFEYAEATFYMNDGVYGSTFYLTTGFHGFHVFVGTLFLIVSLFSLLSSQLLTGHHFGYEAAIRYRHFVDVVWLFLYIFVYCWSAGLMNLEF